MISGAFSQIIAKMGSTRVACLKQEHLNRCFFDTMFKYNGWAASAYMSRMTDNAITVNPLDRTKTQAVFVGGIDTQLSYVFLQIIK
jgi:hypothetical protein